MELPWICKNSEEAQFKVHIMLKGCKGAQGQPQWIQNGQADPVTLNAGSFQGGDYPQ